MESWRAIFIEETMMQEKLLLPKLVFEQHYTTKWSKNYEKMSISWMTRSFTSSTTWWDQRNIRCEVESKTNSHCNLYQGFQVKYWKTSRNLTKTLQQRHHSTISTLIWRNSNDYLIISSFYKKKGIEMDDRFSTGVIVLSK